jgi:hypothetical protein
VLTRKSINGCSERGPVTFQSHAIS